MEGSKYGSDPRALRGPGLINDWEEGIDDETTARVHFLYLKKSLEKYGVQFTPDLKLLEVGSGNNFFLKYLQKQGLDVVGVDARPRGEANQKNAAARIEQLPFPDNSFEVVISNALFDSDVYKQDQQAMVREIARVLKPGGVYHGTVNLNTPPVAEYFDVLEEEDRIWRRGIYRKKAVTTEEG